jgi:glycerol kinase
MDISSGISVIFVSLVPSVSQQGITERNILGSVIRPTVTETTALGAAYLAGLAVGYWESIEHIKKQWGVEKEFQPSAAPETVAALKDGWNDAIRRTLTGK